MLKTVFIILVWSMITLQGFLATNLTSRADEYNIHHSNRKDRLLNVFQIVRFPNSPCSADVGFKNGTCYTAEECETRGGAAKATCASGFGVCCIFSMNCGESTSENCTYFDSTGTETGSCSATVCRLSGAICQMRLDFDNFALTGPSTDTTTVGVTNRGIAAGVGAPVAVAGQCMTDMFRVSGGSGNSLPIICGTNSGRHMYVDVARNMDCITLNFFLDTKGKTWSIKVSQYDCDYENLAPTGCTEYYFTGQTGTISSYNFDGGQHLANQIHSLCIRRHENHCRICYYASILTDFALSHKTTKGGAVKLAFSYQRCCGYGGNGISTTGYDCLFVPRAEKSSDGATVRSEFCGRNKGLITSINTMVAKTICTTLLPFHLLFLSDPFEFTGAAITEATAMDIGFKLTWAQDTTNCP